MRFRHGLGYDAPPAEVLARLADPAFRVPLAGGRPEKRLAARITAGLDAEHQVGVAHLRDRT